MRVTEWVLVDTETSGLGRPIYCVEIAAQRMRGTSPDGPPFRALLNHDVDIDPQAEALHGYSREFLRVNGRHPVDVHRDFDLYAGQRPLVAYNLSFDWARVLEPEAQRLGITPAYTPGFCALTLARRCIYESEGHKLDTLRQVFFPKHAPASHHALDDVIVTAKIIVEVIWPRLENAGIESFSAVADFSRKTPVAMCIDRIRSPKAVSLVSSAPIVTDLEGELIAMINAMLADEKIVDAEVWTLKHWLDGHADHKSQLATRSRGLISAVFADGQLTSWELDDIKFELKRLVGDESPAQSQARPSDIPPTERKVEKKRRLSLTKRQLEERSGAALLALLERIVADGILSDEEVTELTNWLIENQGEDLPAIGYLIDVVKDILADGKVTDDERVDLFLGIEKVLPVTERQVAKAAREDADAKAASERLPKIGREELKAMAATEELPSFKRNTAWRSDPMTDAQRAFVSSMGGSIRASASKGEASDMIDSLLGKKPITSRQQMVMRFWSRKRQPGEGPREISEWMDEFYREDGDRKLAWELFKNEAEDDGLQGDPGRVPSGIGPEYLRRVKLGGEHAIPRFKTAAPMQNTVPLLVKGTKNKTSGRPRLVAAIALVVVVLGVVVMTAGKKEPHQVAPAAVSPVRTAASAQQGASTPTNLGSSVQPETKKQTGDGLRAAVAQYRMTGIIGGPNARVIVDGQMYRVGDVVDRHRGILVREIDVDKRSIEFGDADGNTTTRTLD